jgi:cytochrome c6
MKTPFVVAALICLGSAAAAAADAPAIWTAQCQKCHGADGKGQTVMGKKLHLKDFTAASVQAELTDAAMTTAIKEGIKSKEGNTLMKPAEGVTDADITALVKLVRGMVPPPPKAP